MVVVMPCQAQGTFQQERVQALPAFLEFLGRQGHEVHFDGQLADFHAVAHMAMVGTFVSCRCPTVNIDIWAI